MRQNKIPLSQTFSEEICVSTVATDIRLPNGRSMLLSADGYSIRNAGENLWPVLSGKYWFVWLLNNLNDTCKNIACLYHSMPTVMKGDIDLLSSQVNNFLSFSYISPSLHRILVFWSRILLNIWEPRLKSQNNFQFPTDLFGRHSYFIWYVTQHQWLQQTWKFSQHCAKYLHLRLQWVFPQFFCHLVFTFTKTLHSLSFS